VGSGIKDIDNLLWQSIRRRIWIIDGVSQCNAVKDSKPRQGRGGCIIAPPSLGTFG